MEKNAGLGAALNYGIDGSRIARQQTEDTACPFGIEAFCERFDRMENDADIVVVLGGTNDYGGGNAPFGTFEDRTMDTFCGALHYLMRGLIEKYPDAVICFMTPTHRAEEAKPSKGNGMPFLAYVDKIRETAEFYSLPVLDLYAEAGIAPDILVNRRRFCMEDGLHLNDNGHARIAERLQAFLERL